MRRDRFGESGEIVTAFEDRDETAAGVTVGNRQQLLGQPDEVLRLDVELRDSPVRVSVFCRNATNKLYSTTGTTFLDQLGWAFSQYGEPRRIGMQVDVDW